MKTITIYTDGACSGNPGPGGWGVVALSKCAGGTFAAETRPAVTDEGNPIVKKGESGI